jgi:hypothetical protein
MKKKSAKHAVAHKKASGRPTKKVAAMKPRSMSDRAAEVEANLGGSQPLRDFLSKVGWY